MPATPINWVEDIIPRSDDPEWEDKMDDRLLWRGTNTGIWHAENTKWRSAQRGRLVDWATKRFDENVTVLRPPRHAKQKVGPAVEVKQSKYGPALLDVAFAGAPGSCAPETCELLREIFEFRSMQNIKAAGNYKYVLDVSFPPLIFYAVYQVLMKTACVIGRWQWLVQPLQAFDNLQLVSFQVDGVSGMASC
jgi:hypothetical protein